MRELFGLQSRVRIFTRCSKLNSCLSLARNCQEGGAVKYKLVYQMKIFQDRCTPRSQGLDYRSTTTIKQMVGCICREHGSNSFVSWCRGSKVHHIAKIDHSCDNVLSLIKICRGLSSIIAYGFERSWPCISRTSRREYTPVTPQLHSVEDLHGTEC